MCEMKVQVNHFSCGYVVIPTSFVSPFEVILLKINTLWVCIILSSLSQYHSLISPKYNTSLSWLLLLWSPVWNFELWLWTLHWFKFSLAILVPSGCLSTSLNEPYCDSGGFVCICKSVNIRYFPTYINFNFFNGLQLIKCCLYNPMLQLYLNAIYFGLYFKWN